MDDWPVLLGMWERSARRGSDARGATGAQWNREIKALYGLGISIEDVLRCLYQDRPSQEAFKRWIAARMRVPAPQSAAPPCYALSAADRAFWDQNGYLVLRGAIARDQCLAAREAIWDYLGASESDPRSWYREHPGKRGLMLEFSDHPALETNRGSARVRQAYEQLYGSSAIYKSIDKVSFNPPETASWKFKGSALHWDASLRLPIPDKLQGLLYLGDCAERDGAFHCVPGFHKRIGDWLAGVPAGVHPRDWAVRTLAPTAIAGEAGDFIIWHQALPHCASPNHGPLPRLVQYLTYLPDHGSDQPEWL